MAGNTEVKVGDKVRSLVTQYDVQEGNEYLVLEAHDDGCVYVYDDSQERFLLLDHEYETLPASVLPVAEATVNYKEGDRVILTKDGKSTTGAAGKLATITAWTDGKIFDDGEYLLKIDPPYDYETLSATREYTRATPDCFMRVSDVSEAREIPGIKSNAAIVAPLTIREGAYYRTRDGRKIGPMGTWCANDRFFFSYGDEENGLWNKDGYAHHEALHESPDLIAEWTDEDEGVLAASGEAVLGDSETDVSAAYKEAIAEATGPDSTVAMSAKAGEMAWGHPNAGFHINVDTASPPIVTVNKGKLVKTPRGYGYELARYERWSWVDTGNSQPVIVATNKLVEVPA